MFTLVDRLVFRVATHLKPFELLHDAESIGSGSTFRTFRRLRLLLEHPKLGADVQVFEAFVFIVAAA